MSIHQQQSLAFSAVFIIRCLSTRMEGRVALARDPEKTDKFGNNLYNWQRELLGAVQ